MTAQCSFNTPTLGVIEGYYGREWSMSDRMSVVTELARLGYNQFIYAPKGHAKLRADWRNCWSDNELSELEGWVRHCSAQGVVAGMGLSPMQLDLSRAADRIALDTKISQLNDLQLGLLSVLFDDVPSSGKHMATSQLAIVDYIAARCDVGNIIVCPSYYTTDKVLEQLFGEMPKGYWRELGLGLDPSIGVYWTGDKVCSDIYTRENLDFIANQIRRPPVLWDNYPVNDGKLTCQFLHLLPYTGRPAWLADYCQAHHVNPMNQPNLSLLPLATLPEVYRGNSEAQAAKIRELWGGYISNVCEPQLAQSLLDDAEFFQCEGLDSMSTNLKSQLREKYLGFGGSYAMEIVAWLDGQYAFDPACLTG